MPRQNKREYKLCLRSMEFFDGNIDLKEVLESELEAFKSDYFYCEKCKNL